MEPLDLQCGFPGGSGLRADLVLPGGSSIPNGDRLHYYMQVNLGVNHIYHCSESSTLTAGFDLINVLDKTYQSNERDAGSGKASRCA